MRTPIRPLLAATAIAFAAFSAYGQTPTGDPVAITNITVDASTVSLAWEAPPGKSVGDLKLYESTNLTENVWTEVAAAKNLGDVTLAATVPMKFFRLYAAKAGDGPFPYTPGTEVTWDKVDHTILINLTNSFKVTRYPANHDVKADPASGTHHLYLRRIKASGAFNMGLAIGDMGNNVAPKSITLTKDYYIGVYAVTAYQHAKIDAYPAASSPALNTAAVGGMIGTTLRGSVAPSVPTPAGWLKKLEDAVKDGNDGLALQFDLPTEAQWEYACRAGTTGSFNNSHEYMEDNNGMFPTSPPFNATWTNRIGEVAFWARVDTVSRTAAEPVGQKKPNRAGMYDCHGNVWEYCLDTRASAGNAGISYTSNIGDTPMNTSTVTTSLRGGSYNTTAEESRSGFRYSGSTARANYGFRLCAKGVAVAEP